MCSIHVVSFQYFLLFISCSISRCLSVVISPFSVVIENVLYCKIVYADILVKKPNNKSESRIQYSFPSARPCRLYVIVFLYVHICFYGPVGE